MVAGDLLKVTVLALLARNKGDLSCFWHIVRGRGKNLKSQRRENMLAKNEETCIFFFFFFWS